MAKPTTITINWETKHKLEQLKFNIETELEHSITWDEFFTYIKITKGENNG